MTPREAFKLGFLQKCAADGLSNEETLARIKHAKAMMKAGEGWTDWVPGAGAVQGLSKATLAAALAAPPLLGVLGGGLLSDATSHNYDIAEAKKREELAEYQRAVKAMQAMHAKNKQQMG